MTPESQSVPLPLLKRAVPVQDNTIIGVDSVCSGRSVAGNDVDDISVIRGDDSRDRHARVVFRPHDNGFCVVGKLEHSEFDIGTEDNGFGYAVAVDDERIGGSEGQGRGPVCRIREIVVFGLAAP